MKIKFLVDRKVLDHNGKVVESFKAGQVKEMSEASMRHWLNRNVAEIYVKPLRVVAKAEEAEEVEEAVEADKTDKAQK